MSKAIGTLERTALGSRQMLDHPFERFAYLRAQAPLSWATAPQLLPGKGGFLLTRFDDVMAVHSDDRFSTDVMKYTSIGRYSWALPATGRMLMQTMVFKDDPDHKRLRTLVHKAFTPKLVATMEPDIVKIAERLADEVQAKRDVDLAHEYAVRLPLAVIAGMLGVADEERDEFHRLVESLGAGGGKVRSLINAHRLAKLFERLIEERRANPDDGLISQLVAANEDGDRLSHTETVAMVFLLLLAGHDTTASLIGSSVLALIQHPEQLELLRAQPELLGGSGIEELLRFTSPVASGAARLATEDVELHGVTVPRGAYILGMISAANRDETAFDDPESLDLVRKPNRHLAFNFGMHYCLGHQLARLEGRIALTALLQRFPNWELTVPPERLHYKPTVSLRGLTKLPTRMY